MVQKTLLKWFNGLLTQENLVSQIKMGIMGTRIQFTKNF